MPSNVKYAYYHHPSMKVTAVTDSYHPTSDGVVVAVDAYSKALSTVGIDCEIIAPDSGNDKDKRKKLGDNARRVAENQNVKNTVDIIENVYRKVLSQKEQVIQ